MDNKNYKTKKVIGFDVDGTLSESRSKIDLETANLLSKLLETKKVAIITGGAFSDIEKQILENLKLSEKSKKNLILLPTNGGSLFVFNKDWKEISSHRFNDLEKKTIISAIKEVTGDNVCLKKDGCFGKKIQDRESEITYSALGDEAPIKNKADWDPDISKRVDLKNRLSEALPGFEVKIGGKTSIDITPKGTDKAYGMRRLMKYLDLEKNDVLFVGDALYEGGNDFPVFMAGIDSIKVSGPEETRKIIKNILEY